MAQSNLHMPTLYHPPLPQGGPTEYPLSQDGRTGPPSLYQRGPTEYPLSQGGRTGPPSLQPRGPTEYPLSQDGRTGPPSFHQRGPAMSPSLPQRGPVELPPLPQRRQNGSIPPSPREGKPLPHRPPKPQTLRSGEWKQEDYIRKQRENIEFT
jgi:hypothetical protein